MSRNLSILTLDKCKRSSFQNILLKKKRHWTMSETEITLIIYNLLITGITGYNGGWVKSISNLLTADSKEL